jgi:hypothetical protein
MMNKNKKGHPVRKQDDLSRTIINAFQLDHLE